MILNYQIYFYYFFAYSLLILIKCRTLSAYYIVLRNSNFVKKEPLIYVFYCAKVILYAIWEDITAPVVRTVSSTSKEITFSATDGVGITAYAVTTNDSAPKLTKTEGVAGDDGLGEWIECESTTEITDLTLGEYSHARAYYVWARDNAGNISVGKQIYTDTIPAGIETGSITFTSTVWSGATATTTVSTSTDYTIQYQINSTSSEGWIECESGHEFTDLTHGTIIYARLTDGYNAAEYATQNILDDTNPSLLSISATTSKLTFSAEDIQSGISGYAITTSSSAPTSYTTWNGSSTTASTSNNTVEYLWIKNGAGLTTYQKFQIHSHTGNSSSGGGCYGTRNTGTRTCSTCGGAGYYYSYYSYNCSTCGGSGSVSSTSTCSKCGGSGSVKSTSGCWSCSGTGWMKNPSETRSNYMYHMWW